MVQFVLDMSITSAISATPSVPTTADVTVTTDSWYEISVPAATFAAVFPVKFTGTSLPDWSGNVGTDDFTDKDGSVPQLDTILGDTWESAGSAAGTTAEAKSGYSVTDMCNAIANQFFGANIAGEIFDNETAVKTTIQTALDDLLQNGHSDGANKNENNGAAFFLKRMLDEDADNSDDRIKTWATANASNFGTGVDLPFKTNDTIIIGISSFSFTATNPLNNDVPETITSTSGANYVSGHITITLT
jgi:hypothetical protein